jgi:hypothetical protein
MKLYLCLLSLFSNFVTAMPSKALQRSSNESLDPPVDLGDLSVGEGQNSGLRINVEHEPVDGFGSRLGKRDSLFCNETLCGKISVSEFLPTLKLVDTFYPNSTVCADQDQVDIGVDFQASFASHRSGKTCIVLKSVTSLTNELFNACVKNSNIGSGGCVELEDTGRVCIRNAKASTCV